MASHLTQLPRKQRGVDSASFAVARHRTSLLWAEMDDAIARDRDLELDDRVARETIREHRLATRAKA